MIRLADTGEGGSLFVGEILIHKSSDKRESGEKFEQVCALWAIYEIIKRIQLWGGGQAGHMLSV